MHSKRGDFAQSLQRGSVHAGVDGRGKALFDAARLAVTFSWLSGGNGLLVAFLLAWFPITGCLSRPALVKQFFSFSASSGRMAPASTNGPILAIRRLIVSPPFDTQSLVYRDGEFSYEHDPYAEFLASPADTLTETVRDYFRETGLFAAVVEPGSALQPSLLVEITVSRLYGDFRPGISPVAVLEMRFLFFEASNGIGCRLKFQKDYSARVPLKRRTAYRLVAGWNEALKQVLDKVAGDLRGCLAR